MTADFDTTYFMTCDQRRWVRDFVSQALPMMPMNELYRLTDRALVSHFVVEAAWKWIDPTHHAEVVRCVRSALSHPAAVTAASLYPAAVVAMVQGMDAIATAREPWLRHVFHDILSRHDTCASESEEPAALRL